MLLLSELKTQALRYMVLGDLSRAFRTYEAIVRAVPSDLDARMKVADLCVTARMHDLARRVYAAVAFYDLQGGRPLHALVAAQALHSLGADIATLHESLAQLYGAGSPRLGRGGRLAPPIRRHRCRRRRSSTSPSPTPPRTPPPTRPRRRRA